MNASSDGTVIVRDVSKSFGKLRAVNHVSFSVKSGEIFGLVGPDGAGKTTAMRMLASVMRPDTGSILIDGVDVIADPEQTKRHVSYMPQRFGLYEDLTVDENIRFYADLFEIPYKVWQERAQRLLTASGMMPFRKRLAGQLSGGMKQKLGLTCALVHAPRVLLLDEPTTGVDPVSRREFWQILYSLRAEGVAMVISTAYLDEAERCDRLALLHEGRIMYCDTPHRLKQGMPGAIIRITSLDPRRLLDTVRALEGVKGALLVGNGVHIHVDDAALRLSELSQATAAANIEVSSIEQVEPTIEDLFVALLEHKQQAEQ
ncbi:MAG: ABC transporter ATP-binding protein [Undibacterium sp.]|uniref:ABC transporter ATP-binding protein n=1 Tax=Undibacterium sp. TaxID=1914977 RepID=UPI00271D8CC4|nr:ABC transporter ATP-binding protein [Undibacterium sp.]MDO8654452.1 ABC transporter ATP-binding protein [Undibacterium sp.]